MGAKMKVEKDGLAVWVALYVASGAAQPLLTDAVKYRGGVRSGWPATLVPLLANAIGMALVGQLAKMAQSANDGARRKNMVKGMAVESSGEDDVPAQILARATAVDLASGVLVVSGLLVVGSGVYTVIYSSTTAWTAVLTWMVGGKLEAGQWMGIAFVSIGLMMNAGGVVDGAKDESEEHKGVLLGGVVILVVGTILHAGAFVYNERVIKQAGVSPFQLCTQIGAVETVIISVYNAALVLWYNSDTLYFDSIEQAGSSVQEVLLLYALLILTNSVHALAFFAMLGQLGAVATGILKSVLAVSVFSFAAVFFCAYEVSQCFTAFKAASMLIVLFGSFVYVLSTQQTRVSRRKDIV